MKMMLKWGNTFRYAAHIFMREEEGKKVDFEQRIALFVKYCLRIMTRKSLLAKNECSLLEGTHFFFSYRSIRGASIYGGLSSFLSCTMSKVSLFFHDILFKWNLVMKQSTLDTVTHYLVAICPSSTNFHLPWPYNTTPCNFFY